MPNSASVLPKLSTDREALTAGLSFGQLSQEGGNVAVNEQLVASGLGLLRTPLSRFVCEGIAEKYGDDWWAEGVLEVLTYEKAPTIEDVRRHRHLPESATVESGAESIDISTCLLLLTKHWPRIFASKLGRGHRGWAFELIPVRNANKHLAGKDHESDYAWRALDTMFRVCEPIDSLVAGEIQSLRSTVDLSAYGQLAGVDVGGEVSEPEHSASEMLKVVAEPVTELLGQGAQEQSEEFEDDALVAGPDFSGADLRRQDFSGVNLEGADFSEANLGGANFSGANLSRAVFKGAQLWSANLTDADLSGAFFEGGSLSTKNGVGDVLPANFSGANLDGATLNFAGVNARKVNFAGVNLEGADFSEANLGGANFSGASLRGVNLKGANIKDANTAGVRWV